MSRSLRRDGARNGAGSLFSGFASATSDKAEKSVEWTSGASLEGKCKKQVYSASAVTL